VSLSEKPLFRPKLNADTGAWKSRSICCGTASLGVGNGDGVSSPACTSVALISTIPSSGRVIMGSCACTLRIVSTVFAVCGRLYILPDAWLCLQYRISALLLLSVEAVSLTSSRKASALLDLLLDFVFVECVGLDNAMPIPGEAPSSLGLSSQVESRPRGSSKLCRCEPVLGTLGSVALRRPISGLCMSKVRYSFGGLACGAFTFIGNGRCW
jgi:hypothetical protein